MSADGASSNQHANLIQHPMDFPGDRFTVLATWPEFQNKAPEDVPPFVANYYEQGLENLAARRWDAAGAMFRKALDVATKQLRPDLASNKLYNRIEAMVEGQDLTPAMGQWSHRIRLDGNDAIHEEVPETEEDAAASQQFCEAFLTYAYTLPALVAQGQSKAEPT